MTTKSSDRLSMVETRQEQFIDPLGFALFGLAREGSVPWVDVDTARQSLHLGPGEKHVANMVELDYPEFDFDRCDFRLPFADGEIGGVIATHVLEHLADPRPLIREVARVLAPGCPFNVLVPYGNSLMYLQDLDHKTPFVLDTWKNLLCNSHYDNHYGRPEIPLIIGANFKFAIKEGNEALVTQLIKARQAPGR
ncbi:methyltransferase domain-containing protein [Mycobacterium sp. DL592]|uniref:methyltransferase domain-containing protein n=1 Tax=Mycobacterium sp. DL592 TaxID=2675524 RepID=UPI001AAEBBAC|nr:methyltransferase domain-containing protein [Mycobacterium sp. DL592]